jgi:hypothetical protein
LHNFLAREIKFNILKADENTKIPIWFSIDDDNNYTKYADFNPTLGDKGFIPKKLLSTLKNICHNVNRQTIDKIVKLTHHTMSKKWKAKKRNTYHPEIEIQDLINDTVKSIKEQMK